MYMYLFIFLGTTLIIMVYLTNGMIHSTSFAQDANRNYDEATVFTGKVKNKIQSLFFSGSHVIILFLFYTRPK